MTQREQELRHIIAGDESSADAKQDAQKELDSFRDKKARLAELQALGRNALRDIATREMVVNGKIQPPIKRKGQGYGIACGGETRAHILWAVFHREFPFNFESDAMLCDDSEEELDTSAMPDKCGECVNCLDMASFGGPGRLRRRCELQLTWGRRKESHASREARVDKRKKGTGAAAAAAPTPPSTPLSKCEKILKQLGRQKGAYCFEQPVHTNVRLDGKRYHDVIKKPMDYHTIQTKLGTCSSALRAFIVCFAVACLLILRSRTRLRRCEELHQPGTLCSRRAPRIR